MTISRDDFNNIDSESLETKIFRLLESNPNNAFEFPEIVNNFNVDKAFIKIALDKLLSEDKIERKSKNGEFYFIYKQVVGP